MCSDGIAIEAAEDLASLATGANHLCLAEDAQVPAHTRLADLTEVRELRDAHLGGRGKALDDEQPGWIRQAFEVDREIARSDGDAAGERSTRWSHRRVR